MLIDFKEIVNIADYLNARLMQIIEIYKNI